MGNEETLVLDASVVLAVAFAEEHADWAANAINASTRRLMSAVTVTEVMIQLLNRVQDAADAFEKWSAECGVEVISVDMSQAMEAAVARRTYPLNIGDCFVYTLAKKTGATILTLDKDFKNCGLPVLLPPAK